MNSREIGEDSGEKREDCKAKGEKIIEIYHKTKKILRRKMRTQEI